MSLTRRQMLQSTGAALGLSFLPLRSAFSANRRPKVLYYTRSAGFEHSVVRRNGDQLSHSEKVLTEAAERHGVDVVCSKDGRLFDDDLSGFDVIAFYTSGNLLRPNKQGTPPMTEDGKKNLLDTIAGGKPFIGFHAATDTFRTPRDQKDPYIEMLGAEFSGHGPQQKSKQLVASPKFPGMDGIDGHFELHEEWYAFVKFGDDLHVTLIQETEGMKGGQYDRPKFPSTWAKMYGDGRVFYTSMGHREDVWTSDIFSQVVTGGFEWIMGEAEFDVTPNVAEVTPKANV